MTKGKRLSVGIVGAGNITKRIHAPLLTKLKNYQVKYIADIDESCRTVADYFDTEAVLLDDPNDLPISDVAVLAIPPGVREPYYQLFAERRTPVYAEKPFAVDLDSHKRYVERNNALFCNYMRTWFSTTRQLQLIIANGSFGELQQINVVEEGKVGATGLNKGTAKADAEISGGGVIFERGTHTLSQLLFLLQNWDWQIESVSAEWFDNIDIEVSVRFRFTKGDQSIPVLYRQSRSRPIGNQIQCRFETATLLGDHTDPAEYLAIIPRQSKLERKIRFDVSPSSIHRANVKNRVQELTHVNNWAIDHNEAFYLRWQEFVSYLQSNQGDDKTPAIKTGLEITDIISKIYERTT